VEISGQSYTNVAITNHIDMKLKENQTPPLATPMNK
jgi:hypothetical protein